MGSLIKLFGGKNQKPPTPEHFHWTANYGIQRITPEPCRPPAYEPFFPSEEAAREAGMIRGEAMELSTKGDKSNGVTCLVSALPAVYVPAENDGGDDM